MENQHYSDEEAEAILLAASQRPQKDGMSREALVRTALELGISLSELDAAEQSVRLEKEELNLQREYAHHARKEFVEHLTAYVVVNAFLIFIDLATSKWTGLHWAYYSVLGWGIGLAFSARATYSPSSDDYQKEFEKWKRKQAKKKKAALKAASNSDPGPDLVARLDLNVKERL